MMTAGRVLLRTLSDDPLTQGNGRARGCRFGTSVAGAGGDRRDPRT
jgi:hypothetical protein